MDRRQLLIAGVIAPLAVLVVVLALILARGPGTPQPTPAPPREERPPGPVARENAARPETATTTPDTGSDEVAAAPPRSADGEGLEAPPRRAPRPARPQNVEAFAEDYLRRQSANDVSGLLGLYGDGVRYYSMGRVDAQTIYDDKDAYFRRFPDRSYGLASAVQVTPGADGAATLRFDYDYSAGGGAGGARSGSAWTELDVVPAGGSYLITGEHGSVY